jgi:hypothetical protein
MITKFGRLGNDMYEFLIYTEVIKGQLISKGLLVFSIRPKNERKISAPVG